MRTVKRLVVSMGTHRRSFPSASTNRGGGTPRAPRLSRRRLFKCPRSSIRYIKRSSIVRGWKRSLSFSIVPRYFHSQIRSIREGGEGWAGAKTANSLEKKFIWGRKGEGEEGDFLDNSGKFSLVPGPINSPRLRQLVRGIIAVIIHGAICLEYRDREFQVCGSSSPPLPSPVRSNSRDINY